jgi:hypothetical protein
MNRHRSPLTRACDPKTSTGCACRHEEVIACDPGDRHEMGARDVKDPEPQEEAQERVRSCGLQRKRATS